jgi:hypothetical protein
MVMKIDQVLILLNKVYNTIDDEDLKLEVRYMIEDLQMYRHTLI